MSKKKDLTLFWIGLGLVLFAAICVSVFLFTKDEYAGQAVTGLEIMQRSYPGLYTAGIIGFILGAGFLYLSYASATGSGAIGRKLPGKEWQTILFIILAAILICGPWGKACTDKANGGWTLPKKKTAVHTGHSSLWSTVAAFTSIGKCEHVYVATEQEEVIVKHPQLMGGAYWGPTGRQEGREIVCVKCYLVRKQIIDYGAPMVAPMPVGSFKFDTAVLNRAIFVRDGRLPVDTISLP